MARECFPGTSYKELDTAGGFFGETTDANGKPMTLEKAAAANTPVAQQVVATSTKKYEYLKEK